MTEFVSSLGQVSAVIGAQWGDEGKGKAIDLLAGHFDVIARACGGANAGHTIIVGGKKHVFRLLPSGSLHKGKPVVLGAGMVIHLPTLLEEIQLLEEADIEILSRLFISSSAHIVFDYHKDIDAVLEERRSQAKGEGIGTTKRGIGPAYMDKMARTGIRMFDLSSDLRPELQSRVKDIQNMYGVTINVDKEISQIEEADTILRGCVVDTMALLHESLRKKERILIEGAQATLLDIDHGTYPYVTSSQTTAAGALQGLGLAPKNLDSCIGVAKAYCTRVGAGMFPTEETGEIGERLRERGAEFGSVTGRPRRCGWLSIPDLRYAATINGFDCWNITKLDVLDAEETIPICIEMKGNKPSYETMKGWKTSTQGITSFDALPKEAKAYLHFIEKQTGIKAALIGTGQGREEMIVR